MTTNIIDQYTAFLEKVLTPARLQHSLGSMQVMGELAGVYGFDRETARITGLLHDAAKDLPQEQYERIAAENEIEIRYPCDSDYVLCLHGPVGKCFVQKELGVTDPLILDAIAMHCFSVEGENFHHPLCWCVRFADFLEPTRNWSKVRWLRDGIARYRETVYAGRMEEAAFLHTGWLTQWFSEVGFPLHPNIPRIHHELAERLSLDDSFLDGKLISK